MRELSHTELPPGLRRRLTPGRGLPALLTALLPMAQACSDAAVGPEAPIEYSRETITLVSGGHQPGNEGDHLPKPIVVRLTGEMGTPVVGAPVRFVEGIAEHVAGGSWVPIRTLENLITWRSHPDHSNPIGIKEWADFPESVIERSNGYEYYPMFDVAVRYLLDERGHGRTFADVMALFQDLVTSFNFASSFERHMGISVEDYEDEFFELITPYLAEQGASQAPARASSAYTSAYPDRLQMHRSDHGRPRRDGTRGLDEW
jgi:hypothetical protein